jgi:hypothetical protein
METVGLVVEAPPLAGWMMEERGGSPVAQVGEEQGTRRPSITSTHARTHLRSSTGAVHYPSTTRYCSVRECSHLPDTTVMRVDPGIWSTTPDRHRTRELLTPLVDCKGR